jgi:cytochrome c oxidase subunit 3
MSEVQVATAAPEEKAAQDLETQSLGMWIFLASEVLFFGVLFTAYIVYRLNYPQAFAEASRHLNWVIGAANTGILLTSSFFVALAVNAIQRDARRSMLLFLLIVLALGAAFLGLKFLEYSQEFEQNLFPGGNFQFPGADAANAKLFFSLYFTMTGIHAVHMLIAMAAVAGLVFLGWRNKFSSEHYVPVELVGLFWHFVDIVWIFIFPMLYLIDRT